MKMTKKIWKYFGLIMIISLVIALFSPTWTQQIKGENSISELEQVKINGSKHEIMIRGNDKDNPVILVVHGGPGTPEIPYVDTYQDLLETNFTVVHYDQRASGKSYHFGEDYSNLSTDLLVEDLLAMTDYISKRLGKEKVILMAHSAGTYIGMQAADLAPEKYEAYIGIGQMSDTIESEMDGLNYVIDQAKQNGNTEDVLYLQGLTEQIRNGEMVTPRNYVMKYGGATRLIENPGDNISVLLSSEYNLLDVIRYNYGMSYTQQKLLKDILENPLPTIVTKLEMPFYFVMGKYDYMTSSRAAKNYFDKIEADQKEFISFDQSAHYPQFEEKEKFYEWMVDTFLK
ncbi:alpha/beta fold hydrolase [Psychrobacillus lasiicapitis]|uniref:Alpha/beta hydrolase n=1 Tax=Psychrobacillus lasiicapitis TaxID=1636719 RepID=A0A544T4P3_9BACI|nr:alpha/beta hydrolase [Psychrobacillus lasiicapitis]TQR12417.1 alpha/beta hydrolase [Psychrobacillus lasiicapitis]GGA37928.1 alpha/beta hydrolase [Psychrobacillus lasiicapitis]